MSASESFEPPRSPSRGQRLEASTVSQAGWGRSEGKKGASRRPEGTTSPLPPGSQPQPPSPCPRCRDLLAPGLTPSAGRSGLASGPPLPVPKPRPRESPSRAPQGGVWGRHLVCGELDGGARARGSVLAPVGGGFEVRTGNPEFVGGPGQRWGRAGLSALASDAPTPGAEGRLGPEPAQVGSPGRPRPCRSPASVLTNSYPTCSARPRVPPPGRRPRRLLAPPPVCPSLEQGARTGTTEDGGAGGSGGLGPAEGAGGGLWLGVVSRGNREGLREGQGRGCSFQAPGPRGRAPRTRVGRGAEGEDPRAVGDGETESALEPAPSRAQSLR